MTSIRPAELNDLDAITGIYNEAILNSTATFDTEPKGREEQLAWLKDHGGKYVVLVAETGHRVTGWAALSRWSDRCAYSDTAECSIYVESKYRGRGTGRKLMDALVAQAGRSGFHTLIARIAEGNEASVQLCRSAGFNHIGTMREVGRKFGRQLDVHLMQLIFQT